MKLRDIENEISSILDLDEADLTEEQLAALDGYLAELAGQESDKIDSFAQFIRLQSERASALDAESKRLARRAKSIERSINYLKGTYLGTMQEHGLKKVQGNVYSVSIRATPVVRIDDEAKVPLDYWTIKETRSVNKTAIRDAIKLGAEIPGAAMGTSFSLQVR